MLSALLNRLFPYLFVYTVSDEREATYVAKMVKSYVDLHRRCKILLKRNRLTMDESSWEDFRAGLEAELGNLHLMRNKDYEFQDITNNDFKILIKGSGRPSWPFRSILGAFILGMAMGTMIPLMYLAFVSPQLVLSRIIDQCISFFISIIIFIIYEGALWFLKSRRKS